MQKLCFHEVVPFKLKRLHAYVSYVVIHVCLLPCYCYVCNMLCAFDIQRTVHSDIFL
jgi:hypothetical protein